jgi:hypothetical protein
MELNDNWKAGEGEIDGTPFIIRYRPYLQNFIDTGEYKHRMEIFWLYQTDHPAQMPEEEEQQQMQLVENRLAEAFEEDQLAVLAFVYTGHLQNVWHWYTRDIKAAGIRLHEALKGLEEFPVELAVEEDPDWDEYLSMLDAAVEEGEDDEWEDESPQP